MNRVGLVWLYYFAQEDFERVPISSEGPPLKKIDI